MNSISKFITWLSYHPSASDIARALVTEYLVISGPSGAKFVRLNPDDSLTFIGEYGYAQSLEGQSFPGNQWRKWRRGQPGVGFELTTDNWNEDDTACLIPLRDRGVVHGYAMVEFTGPVSDREGVFETLADLCVPISIYFTGEKLINNHGPSQRAVPIRENLSENSGQLTSRQILILRGMVEGKTNHELASDLGFSVSTIRHETMRIYEVLSVSDRKEAAKKAMALSIF